MTNRSIASSRLLIVNTSEKGLKFNGSSDLLTLPFVPSPTGFCFGIWVKLNAKNTGTNQRIIDYAAGGPNGGFQFGESGGNINIGIQNGASVDGSVTYNKEITSLWNFYVVTFLPNSLVLYRNNVLVGTDTSTTMTAPAGQLVTLGRRSSSAVQWFSGILKNLVFHNTTTLWTSDEMLNLYTKNIIPSGSTAFYKFDNTVTDSSGNGNNGTLTGGTYTTDVPSHFTKRSTSSTRSIAIGRQTV